MKTIEWFLIRKYFNENYTIGKLLEDQKIITGTLEDKVRDLQDINHDGDFDDPGEGKIYGKTAIPYGRYKVILNYSPKLKRVLPLLLDVPGYSGIRMHYGLNENWTEGCICLGENKVKGGLINGKYWEAVIINKITEIYEAKNVLYLTIKQ
jgi:hypothetical protein